MRTIDLSTRHFPVPHPPSLCDDNGKELTSLEVSVTSLFHHYWASKYSSEPSLSMQFEYASQITSGPDWRMGGSGIGVDKEAKRNVSNELGKAFARWFMATHFGHAYFCPFETAMRRGANTVGHSWKRRSPGDLPDYICGKDDADINLLEAKGRYKSVSFDNKEFQVFRDQINRAMLCDASGSEISVKGFISAARWATEGNPGVKSKLLVEDPWTEGRRVDSYPGDIGKSMVMGHYASVFRRLQMPVVADCLEYGYQFDSSYQGEQIGIWRCVTGPLEGVEFAGGLLGGGLSHDYCDGYRGRYGYQCRKDKFYLFSPSYFYGLELRLFVSLIKKLKYGESSRNILEPILPPENLGALSLLRDASVLGPGSYFELMNIENLSEI
ncbi:hypothetical protein [Xanthomonas hortorum]|uniref:hypothetical protein n=2 Tax=Xanthomonas hortorum TaxID=56454 RepID=UPI001F1A68F7|nr:hypothetical protein [Xanthomonas hortorum]